MAKLAVLSLLALLGSVACQDSNGSRSASPPAYPPSPSPNPATNPSSPSAPSLASAPYSPSASPMPATYPQSSSPISSPPSYTSSSNPPSYTASGPRPSNYMKSISPMHSPSYPPSSNAPAYPPPSPSPSTTVLPPTYPASDPSPSPSSSTQSPPTYAPGPSPTAYSPSPSPAPSGLSFSYYRYSCPNAEGIVRNAVKSAVDSDPGTGAGLIRLFFHDCFVQGCDASLLLNTTGSTEQTERLSPPNLTLRGFEVIDAAKAALEAACPGVVSCADIVAFAGRDATYFLSTNGVYFEMPAGRYDGRVSRSGEALANLPPPTAGLQVLKDMFAAKGLDADDMVTLSGAHTVGRSRCSSFSDRVPPPGNASDSMNPTLAASLTQQCSNSSGGDPTVMQDFVTPNKLDSQYYWNVLNRDVLFASDAALLASNQTADMVSANAFTPGLWEAKFKAAMVKMGAVGVKTSSDGEIRKKCWMIN